MVDKTTDIHDDNTQGTSEVKDKTTSSTKGCEDKTNNSNNTNNADGSNNISDAEGGNNTSNATSDDKTVNKLESKDVTHIDPDNLLLRSFTSIDDRLKARHEEDLIRKQEIEDERRAALKAANQFAPERLNKSKFLHPIYNDDGEIIGYKNPLHIGHLDLRVGELRKVNLHPNPSKQCHYVETIAINPHVKKPKNFFGSEEDMKKIKDERNLVVESGLPQHYSVDDLWRQKVVVLCNVKPFTSRGVDSKVVVLCAKKGKKVELLQAPREATAGDAIVAKSYPQNPQTPYVINITQNIGDDLRVNEDRQLVYKDEPLKVNNTDGYITAKTLRDCRVSNVMGYEFI